MPRSHHVGRRDLASSPEDRAFARYSRSGDPADLADVYDATASELLRVALHLTASPADAEDLVQATFLAAIECRDRFDAGRRVRPWLLGILSMWAKRLPRERRCPDVERIAKPKPVDPLVHSAELEFDAAVDAAIEALPEAYRPVMRLRLRHGMTAVEIAHALARPAGTVRTQVVRGVELLRARLPASFAGLLVGVSIARAAERGSAGLRDAVLAEAERHATSVLSLGKATLVGAWIVNRVAVCVVAALVVLGACLFAALMHPFAPSSTHEPEIVGGVRTSQARESNRTATVGKRDVRSGAATPDGGPSEATSLALQLTWSGTGRPAAKVAVTLRAIGTCHLLRRVAISNEHGTVRFEGLSAGRYNVVTDRERRMRTDVEAGRENRCSLTLPKGADIRGIVVDERGEAVANADIYLSAGSKRLYEEAVVAKTDPAGRFSIPSLTGRRYVAARAAGKVSSGRTFLEPSEGAGAYPEVRIVLDEEGMRLTGRLLAPSGAGVSGAHVVLGWPIGFDRGPAKSDSPSASASSDDTGAFVLTSLPAGRHRMLVQATGYAPLYQYVEIERGNDTTGTFHLSRGCSVRGRVTSASGTPVAGAEVTAFGVTSLAANARTTRDGGYRIDGLAADLVSLRVRAPGYDEQRVMRTARPGDVVRWSPQLQTQRVCTGRVVNDDGSAASRVEFQVVSKTQRLRGSTDDAGRFRITGMHRDEDYTFYVSLPERSSTHVRCHSTTTIRSGSDGLVLRVPAARAPASIAARLHARPRQSLGADCYAILHQIGPGGQQVTRVSADDASSFPIEFHVAGLVAGDYRLEIGSDSDRFPEFYVSIASLRPGEHRDLGVLSPPNAARLTVEAVSSERAIGNSLLCKVRGLDVDYEVLRRLEEGKRTMTLVPGTYEVAILGHNVVCASRQVAVGADEDRKLRFDVGTGVSRQLVFRFPDDRPLADVHAVLKDERGRVVARHQEFSDTLFPFSWSPALAPGIYTVEMSDPSARRPTVGGTFVIEDLLPRCKPVCVQLR